MLDVGVSGKKRGQGYKTQALVNDRFRLELRRRSEIAPQELSGSPMIAMPKRAIIEHDPISSGLKKASKLVGQYPPKFRSQLHRGLCNSNGNGWQLLESFPLAFRAILQTA